MTMNTTKRPDVRSPRTSPRTPNSPSKATRAKPAPRPLPLAAIVAEFLDEVDQTLAPSTLRSYRIPLDLYLRHLHATLDREPTLPDLNLETARAGMTYLRTAHKHQNAGQQEGDQPITLASLRNYLRRLRAFANWLAKPPQGYCADSPLKYLKLPRGEETPKVPVEPGDLRKLLQRAGQEPDTVAGARGKALLLTLVDGGLRARELIHLTIADVSLKDGILLVRRAKGKRPRLVALGNETVRALRRYALLRDGRMGHAPPADAPFFLTVKGAAFTYFGLRSWLMRLERDTGVRHVHLHPLAAHLGHRDAGCWRGHPHRAAQAWPCRHPHHPGLSQPVGGPGGRAPTGVQPGGSPRPLRGWGRPAGQAPSRRAAGTPTVLSTGQRKARTDQ